VHVYYGTSAGLPPSSDTFFAESTPGVPEEVEDQDWFGYSLACGDFDDDGFDDQAVGTPGEAWGGVVCVPGAPCSLLKGNRLALPRRAELPALKERQRGVGRRSAGLNVRLSSRALTGGGRLDARR
jgi:hypothetical protein